MLIAVNMEVWIAPLKAYINFCKFLLLFILMSKVIIGGQYDFKVSLRQAKKLVNWTGKTRGNQVVCRGGGGEVRSGFFNLIFKEKIAASVVVKPLALITLAMLATLHLRELALDSSPISKLFEGSVSVQETTNMHFMLCHLSVRWQQFENRICLSFLHHSQY